MKSLAAVVFLTALIGSAQLELSPTYVQLSPAHAQTPPRAAVASPAVGTARISGRVVAAATGRPIQGARVGLGKLGTTPYTRDTRTDANGVYAFLDLPAGTYSFFATHPTYLEQHFDQPRPLARYRLLELAEGDKLDGIDFKLHRGGVITGVVTDENGEPFPGLRVTALREMVGAMGRSFFPVRAELVIQTDDRGRFRLYGLQPGAYLVLASLLRTSDAQLDVGRTYYPGTLNVSDAQTVRVDLTSEAAADFSIVAARHARVAGIARDSLGNPPPRSVATLISPLGVQYDTIAYSEIDAGGHFSLENVPPGDHVLQVRPRAYGGHVTTTSSEWAVMPVTIAGSDVTDLIVTTSSGFTVSGRVTFDTSSIRPAFKGVKVAAHPVDRSGRWMMPSPPAHNGNVDSEGRFRISGVTGRVHVVPGSPLPSGWFFKRALLRGADVTLSGVDVNGDLDGLEVVLTDRATTVTGTARDPHGTQLKDFIVVFFPAGQFDERDRGRRQRTIRPDPDGVYRIRNLPPGNYLAAAVPVLSLPMGAEWDPAVAQTLAAIATPFALSEGEHLALILTLRD